MKHINSQSGKGLLWFLIIAIIIIAIVIFTGKKHDSEGSYTITVTNTSQTQVLSPGVYAVHTDEASFNFEGQLSPSELEPLAEFGSHANFAAFANEAEGVYEVVTIDAPVLPGESTSFDITVPEGRYYLSGIMMAVASNDGYALLDAAPLNSKKEASYFAENHDNGTEENSELGSGFAGGQPDPSQGELNIANGTKTEPQEKVAIHRQLVDIIMEVTISPLEQ